MPALKIKDFKGMMTNYDQDDISPAYVQESINAVNKLNYVKVDPTLLTRYVATTEATGLPLTATTLPDPTKYYKHIHSILAANASSPITYKSNTEVIGTWEFDCDSPTTTTDLIKIFPIASTTSLSTLNGYGAKIVWSSGHIALIKYVAGAETELTSVDVGELTGWINVRFFRNSSGELTLEIKQTNSTETIILQATDTDFTTSTYSVIKSAEGSKYKNMHSPTRSLPAETWTWTNTDFIVEDPDISPTWVWETGIRVLLTEDRYTPIFTADQDWNLILIAKGTSGSTYYRQIWRLEEGSSNWYYMAKEGNYIPTSGSIEISDSFYSTETVGDITTRIQGGKLYIYMPHDCFVVSKINRNYNAPSNWLATYNGYHIDRLSENIDLNKTSISGSYCTPDKRLGCSLDLSIVEGSDISSTVTTECRMVLDKFQDWHSFSGGLLYSRGWFAHFEDLNGNPVAGPRPMLQGSIVNPGMVAEENASTGNQFFLGEEGVGFTGLYVVSDVPAGGGSIPNPDLTFYGFTEIATPKDSSWGTAPYNRAVSGCPVPHGSKINEAYGGATIWYKLYKEELTATTWMVNTGETVPFEKDYEKAYVVATAILDGESEIIAAVSSVTISSTESQFGIKATVNLAKDFNKRVTAIRLYVKFIDRLTHEATSDFELVKTFDMLSTENQYWDNAVFTESDLKGTLLSQNISFMLDEDKLYEYQVLTGFSNISTVDGISIASVSGDNVNFYYSVVGNGVLQPNLIYRANILKDIPFETITASAVGNGFFFIMSNTASYVLKITPAGTVAAFTVIGGLEEGAVTNKVLKSIQGGVITTGLNGISFLDGYKTQPMSTQIENLIVDTQSTAKLFYNEKDHQLLYITPTKIYRLRLLDEAWEELNFSSLTGFTIGNFKQAFVDKDGKFSYLMTDSLWVPGGSTGLGLTITSNDISMDEPGIEKRFESLVVDYEGNANILLYFDGTLKATYTLGDLASRGRKTLSLSLAKNSLFKTLKYVINNTTSDFKLYNLVINFDYFWKTEVGDDNQYDASYTVTNA